MVGADGPPGLQGPVDWCSGPVLRREVYDGVPSVAGHVPQDEGQDRGRVDRHVDQGGRLS